MKLADVELIAKAAEKACVAVMNRPKDGLAREDLFDKLGKVVDPAFIETDPTRSGRLNDLLSKQACGAISYAAGSTSLGKLGLEKLPRHPSGIQRESYSASSTRSSTS
jgi:hypothetical protein